MKMSMRFVRFFAFTFPLLFSTTVAWANQCSQLEADGRLIRQQLKQSKVCRTSSVEETWTDCEFSAGKTRILLVGAIGTSPESRAMGIRGSGFHVLSVDPMMTVRVLVDSGSDLVLRLDGTDNLLSSGCLYNEALITLDARVLGPGERVRDSGTATTERDSIKSAQTYLRQLGYDPGPIDGNMGVRTRAALENFRRERNIPSGTSEDLLLTKVLLEALEAAYKKLK